MKPLLTRKVARGRTITEWISSTEQLTDDGRADFAQRQEMRRRQMQGAAEPEPSNVELISTVRRKGRR